MPETIRIEDLQNPVLNEAQAQMLARGEEATFALSVDAVLTAASTRACLDDFGPDDFLERLSLLLDVVAWEGHTKAQQLSSYNRLVSKAIDRLLTVDLLARHPEIRDEEIRAPVIIAGLPRSGTTHFHNLVAADSRFQSTPYWEVLRPIPLLPEDEVGADGVDPRWLRAQAGWEGLQASIPIAAAFHPMNPDHISEDGELQMGDFSSYVWEFSLRAPDWRDYYLAHDQTPHYEYEKTMLQILQWQRGESKRWIVKAPQHLEQLAPIMRVFPDAVVVFTHRDPVGSLQSIATFNAFAARIRERSVDMDYVIDYWSDRYERLLDAYVRDIDLVPDSQRFDVLFHEFVGDDVATVERMYGVAGIEMSPAALAELRAYMADHGRGSSGRIRFDIRRDFGVDPAAIRERYSAYTERVPVAIEVT